eukprot:11762141-Karenia_brevis.AAC.1
MAPKIRRRPATSIASSSGISSSENTDRPASGTLLEHSSGNVPPSALEHSLVGRPVKHHRTRHSAGPGG